MHHWKDYNSESQHCLRNTNQEVEDLNNDPSIPTSDLDDAQSIDE